MNSNSTLWELIFIGLKLNEPQIAAESVGIINKSDISHHSLQKEKTNLYWEVGAHKRGMGSMSRKEKRKSRTLMWSLGLTSVNFF